MSRKLDQIEGNTTSLDLGQFVNRVNRLLESFVPEVFEVSQNDAFEYDEETILYYQDEGIIDRVGEGWGEFGYRQILQALLLKKLLVRGLPMRRIAFLMKEMDNSAYKRLLIGPIEGEGDVAIEEYYDDQFYEPGSSNHYLSPTSSVDDLVIEKASSSTSSISREDQFWLRLPILPGLEIHISNRFRLPRSESERRSVFKMIKMAIEQNQNRF